MIGILAEAGTDSSASYQVGQTFALILPLAVIAATAPSLKKEGTQKTCVYSLLAVCLGWGLLQLLGVVGAVSNPNIVLRLSLLAVALVPNVVGVVLAIVGLVQYASQPGHYQRGRKHAIWALVLSVFVAGSVVAGFVRGIVGSQLAKGAAREGEVQNFEKLNFRFRAPGTPWAKMDIQRVNKDATLGYIRIKPQMIFMIIAERVDVELALDAMVEVVKSNLRSTATKVESQTEEPVEIAGLRGVRLVTQYRLGSTPLTQVNCVIVQGPCMYQLMTGGPLAGENAIRAASTEMVKRFQLIDTNLTAAVIAKENRPAEYHSATYGYRVTATNDPWRVWSARATEMPSSDYGVISDRINGLAVVAVDLLQTDPSLDALSRGFMSRFDIPYPSERIHELRPIVQGICTGQTFSTERKSDDDEEYVDRFRVLRANRRAFLLTAWVNKKRGVPTAELDAALDTVTFEAGAVPPLDPARLSAREIKLHAQVLNAAGLYYYDAGQYDRAVAQFRVAGSLLPKEEMYFKNALDALARQKRHQEALDYYTAGQTPFASNWAVRSWQPFLLAELNRPAEAVAAYQQLFAAGYRDDNDFAAYGDLLAETKSVPAAQAALAEYLQGGDSPAIRQYQARLYKRAKDYAKAIEILRGLQEKRPFDAKITTALAENHFMADDYTETVRVCRQMIERNLDSAYVHYLRGRAELSLKWYREAKASFEASLKQDPKDEDTREYLTHVAGILGEGNNTSIRVAIPPVPLPALLGEELPATPEAYWKGYHAHYLRRIRAISYKAGVEYRTTDYIQVKVTSSSGVSEFSTIQISFDPLGEAIYPNRVIVRDAAGQLVAEGKLDDFYVLDDTSRNMATHDKVLHLPVPGLQVGYTVEVVVTRRDLGTPKEFRFMRHWFARGLPVRRAAVYVTGEIPDVGAVTPPPLVAHRTAEGLCWLVDNGPLLREESYAPASERFLPVLSLGNASNDWAALGQDYLTKIADRLEAAASLADIVRQQTNGLAATAERAFALARYCQGALTYKAIEFGSRAQIPNRSTDILHNKYGDCKDHSLLLHQLLRQAGIPSVLALVNTQSAVVEKLPSLDQFNHMIVYLPTVGGGQFIDITTKHTDPSVAVPYGLSQQTALLLETPARLHTLPAYSGDSGQITSEQQIARTNDIDLVIHETATFAGYYASYMRSLLNPVPTNELQKTITSQMAQGGITPALQQVEVRNLDRLTEPLVVEVRYTIAGAVQRHEDQLHLRLPALWERQFLEVNPVPNRQTPFRFFYPIRYTSRVTLELPAGYELATNGNLNRETKERFVSGQTKVAAQATRVSVAHLFERPSGEYPAAEFGRFQTASAELLDSAQPQLVFKPRAR